MQHHCLAHYNYTMTSYYLHCSSPSRRFKGMEPILDDLQTRHGQMQNSSNFSGTAQQCSERDPLISSEFGTFAIHPSATCSNEAFTHWRSVHLHHVGPKMTFKLHAQCIYIEISSLASAISYMLILPTWHGCSWTNSMVLGVEWCSRLTVKGLIEWSDKCAVGRKFWQCPVALWPNKENNSLADFIFNLEPNDRSDIYEQ